MEHTRRNAVSANRDSETGKRETRFVRDRNTWDRNTWTSMFYRGEHLDIHAGNTWTSMFYRGAQRLQDNAWVVSPEVV